MAVRAQTPLLERDAELGVLGAAVASGEGSFAVVEGAAGIGKSRLLDGARRLARDREMTVLCATGRDLESSFAFGVARQLFEPLGEFPSRADELELIHALYRTTAALAADGGVLVAVDDAHWADRSSLRFLLYLGQRLDAHAAVVACALRPGEPDAPAELLARLADLAGERRLRLRGLSAGACGDLVRALRPDATAAFCSAAARVCGGNPLLVEELVRAVEAEGVAPDGRAASRAEALVPERVLHHTLRRLGRLPPGSRELAEAVAVLGSDVELRHAVALGGLERAGAVRAADALAAVEILRPGEPLSFVHPLVRGAVHAAIPPAELGERHRRAARVLSDQPEAAAAHLLRAPATGDAWAVEELRAAARAAVARGAGAPAGLYLRRALDEGPAREVRARVLIELADAESMVGEPAAVEHLRAALDGLPPGRERAEGLYRLGWALFSAGHPNSALDAFAMGVEAAGDDVRLRTRLRTVQRAMTWLSAPRGPGTPEPRFLVESTPEALAEASPELCIQLAVARIFAGEGCAEARALAERVLADGTLLRDHGGLTLELTMAISCLIWTDALDAAERELQPVVEESEHRGAQMAVALCRFGRSWIRWRQGRVAEAAADAGAAIEAWRGGWGGQLPHARYWQAVSLVELDRVDEARAAVSAGLEEARDADDFYRALLHLGGGIAALAAGDAGAARTYLRECERLSRPLPFMNNPAAHPWRSHAALAAAATGDSSEAHALVDEEVEIARRFGAPYGVGVALRARGLVVGGEPGLALLAEAVDTLEASPSRIELIRALVSYGGALRRAGRRASAREPLRRALDMATAVDAVALAARARAELTAAGARPRRDAATGVGSLTPSERRVADLAAAGHSNPDIAAQLYISRRTVEHHLRLIFRKLGISSRDELGGALRR